MRTHKKDFLQRLLGNTRLSKRPLFLNYKPHSFALKARHTREVMKIVQPGDILVRSYNKYLDGHFIPGTFTHVGFYLGQVNDTYLKQLAKIDNPLQYNRGPQMVIHTLGDKVLLEDLIDFCRCDGLAIMRFPQQLKRLAPDRQIPERLKAYFANPAQPVVATDVEQEAEDDEENPKKKKKSAKKKAPPAATEPVVVNTAFVKAEKDIAEHLAKGGTLEFAKAFKVLYCVALGELGMPFQFNFGFDDCEALACTEFLYFITKSLSWNYGIEPQPRRVFLKQLSVIEPDDYINGDLEEAWKAVR